MLLYVHECLYAYTYMLSMMNAFEETLYAGKSIHEARRDRSDGIYAGVCVLKPKRRQKDINTNMNIILLLCMQWVRDK